MPLFPDHQLHTNIRRARLHNKIAMQTADTSNLIRSEAELLLEKVCVRRLCAHGSDPGASHADIH